MVQLSAELRTEVLVCVPQLLVRVSSAIWQSAMKGAMAEVVHAAGGDWAVAEGC